MPLNSNMNKTISANIYKTEIYTVSVQKLKSPQCLAKPISNNKLKKKRNKQFKIKLKNNIVVEHRMTHQIIK